MQPGQPNPKDLALQAIKHDKVTGNCYLCRSANPFETPYLLTVEPGSRADEQAKLRTKEWRWQFLGQFKNGERVFVKMTPKEIEDREA